MEVVVQQLNRKLFLTEAGEWTGLREEAKQFGTVLEAISLCIHEGKREVKMVGKGETGGDVYLYPFGGDPAAKAERRRVRREIAESRRLKHEQHMIRARIDLLMAEVKEKKKQFPFTREAISEGE